MRSDGSKNGNIFIKMESESVFHGNGTFPSILNPFDFFHPEGWMKHILKEQRQFLIECLPDFMGQAFVLFLELIAETESAYLSNHLKPSSAV